MLVEKATHIDYSSLNFRFGSAVDKQAVDDMAENVEQAMEETAKLRLLLDFRQTSSFEPDAFISLKGAFVSAKSVDPVERYGVVGAPDIAARAVEAFGTLLPLEARSFDASEFAEAHNWIFSA